MAASDKKHDYVALVTKFLVNNLANPHNTATTPDVTDVTDVTATAGLATTPSNITSTDVSSNSNITTSITTSFDRNAGMVGREECDREEGGRNDNKKYEKSGVTVHKYCSAAWERMATDRFETLEFLDPYLGFHTHHPYTYTTSTPTYSHASYESSENHAKEYSLEEAEQNEGPFIDLITIQWGENASDITTFQADFEELLLYIKQRAPRAQILVIGDFWENGDRDRQKALACQKMSVPYVSLVAIKDRKEYMVGMGTIVYGANGEEHKIEHAGVAKHPGDEGMRFINEQVIKEITQYHRRTGD